VTLLIVPTVSARVPAANEHESVPSWLDRWFRELRSATIARVAPDPAAAAVFVVNLTDAYGRDGRHASQRIRSVAEPAAAVLHRAFAHGIGDFVLLHDGNARQPSRFDPVRVLSPAPLRGPALIEPLDALPCADRFTPIRKRSLDPAIGTDLARWLAERPNLRTAIVVGAATDLCVYQLAMYLRQRADVLGIGPFRVVVPADAVDTYHLSVQGSRMVGGLPHPGDFFQRVFLYHIALNGVEVVRSLDEPGDEP
jgi:nicotinamidase-related amidase